MRAKRAQLPGKDVLFGVTSPSPTQPAAEPIAAPVEPEASREQGPANAQVEVEVGERVPERTAEARDTAADVPARPAARPRTRRARSEGAGAATRAPEGPSAAPQARKRVITLPVPSHTSAPPTSPAPPAEPAPVRTQHVQLCVWIAPELAEEVDRTRARLLIERGIKVTKSEIAEVILRERVSDLDALERLLLG